MKNQLELLESAGWVAVGGNGQRCAKCQQPVSGPAILHPRSFRHLHAECALSVSGIRNIAVPPPEKVPA
jgi:hypothetical protein